MNNLPKNVPTILVIMGITGDLAKKKIIPALFNLYTKQKLPKLFKVIGFARRDLSDTDLQKYAQEIVLHLNPEDSKALSEFVKMFSYHQGHFENLDNYENLSAQLGQIDGKWQACSNKLFYLSVPPEKYSEIFNHLKDSGLTIPCSNEEGWTRVLVEKPFGHDAETASQLDEQLSHLFEEEQIYRIDHYLAKEMVQNILSFRFNNDLFKNSWNNEFIESIDIKLWETLGVEQRGSFYDGLGALRDVGQNHLLQMVALATMDQPKSFTASAIRVKRAEILENLTPLTEDQVKSQTYRSQYQGYQQIENVDPNSTTETYFKVICQLDHPEWRNIPITMESGKRMGEVKKEMSITFKHLAPCFCVGEKHYQNKLTFAIDPEEKITIDFWTKTENSKYQVSKRIFESTLKHDGKKRTQYVEEYETLLHECIEGDQTLFVSTPEIKPMWNFIDSITQVWRAGDVELNSYKPDTNEPSHDSKHIASHAMPSLQPQSKNIAVIGLGKMGANIARRLVSREWEVKAFNRTHSVALEMENEGIIPFESVKELVLSNPSPRLIWLMLPAGKPVDDMLFGPSGIVQYLDPGDTLIDGGNSKYSDSSLRAQKLAEKQIEFIDVGVSGGPSGALNGACLMVGGSKTSFIKHEQLYRDLSVSRGYQHFEGSGAGHFTKMVHNGIEYGMMQAIAEGFAILKQSDYKIDLSHASEIYNHGSVIESRLIGWLNDAFELYGQNLEDVSSTVRYTGEGGWTVETAELLNVKAEIIKSALQFRIDSESEPSYTGKVLSALRNSFGGHGIK